ncbi:MAG TPA: PepSY-associated TM helix domain-containing protein, partial [Rhizomicrobium sp.]|nr:PepSY-associated TM helix domain-containing protein [Rhizomicrobium sp.]
MSFAAIRHSLFTVHMWIGLVLGVLLAALGLSGSLLVYDETISDWSAPPPHATTAGQPLPLSMIAGIARDAVTEQGLMVGAMQIIVPQKKADVLVIRLNGVSPMGAQPMQGGAAPEGGRRARPRPLQMYIDPVSGEVLGTRAFAQVPLLTFAHQLHGNFLMGREGRRFVGWLGVAMCLLGVSGLVLWWPKRGQWKYAFKVRGTATGLRFHRELHATTGIWIFLIFMAVSFSGVVIAWPRTMGATQPALRIHVSHAAGQAKSVGATEAVIA